VEENLVYKFQDARAMSLALFIFIEVVSDCEEACTAQQMASSCQTQPQTAEHIQGYHGYFQKSVPVNAR